MPGSGVHIALMHPEIPGNTGNVGRLCVGIEARLHLVHPLGFDTSDKAVRRAGLDYWPDVDLVEHPSRQVFLDWVGGRTVRAFTARAETAFTEVDYPEGVVLLFGCETRGLPTELRGRFPEVLIPAPGRIRSLNLSNAVAVGAYEALRHTRPGWFFGAAGRPALQRG